MLKRGDWRGVGAHRIVEPGRKQLVAIISPVITSETVMNELGARNLDLVAAEIGLRIEDYIGPQVLVFVAALQIVDDRRVGQRLASLVFDLISIKRRIEQDARVDIVFIEQLTIIGEWRYLAGILDPKRLRQVIQIEQRMRPHARP